MQLAARLCSHARPDQILTTEEMVERSAIEKSHFLSRGTITPKGFDYAIEVYEVPWNDA